MGLIEPADFAGAIAAGIRYGSRVTPVFDDGRLGSIYCASKNLCVSPKGVRMSAEIVNLNKVRKARERAGRQRGAQENRLKFGRSKTDGNLISAEKRKRDADLDGAKREPGNDGERGDDNEPGDAS